MLKGISPVISPELLSILYRMGHGDEVVLTDAHFPAETCNTRVIRADGVKVVPLLNAILPLLELDSYVDAPVIMMDPAAGDDCDPEVKKSFQKAIDALAPNTPPIKGIDRFEFYERTKKAFAVVITGELAKYGNVILKKGVTPVSL